LEYLQSSARYRLVGLLLFAWGSFAAVLGYDLKTSYDQAYESANREADSLTQVLERHFSVVIDKIDIVLRKVARSYSPILGGAAPMPPLTQANRDLLDDLGLINEGRVRSLRVVSRDGEVIFNAGQGDVLPDIFVGDRAYFDRQKGDPTAELVISEPIFSRFTSSWMITLSRRISLPDGAFGGLVVVTIPADYFEDVFATLNLGRNGTVALYDTSLRLIARQPQLAGEFGAAYEGFEFHEDLAAGHDTGRYQMMSWADGTTREYFFRKIQDLPLIVVVGTAPKDFMEGWWRKAVFYELSIFALLAELWALLALQGKMARERITFLAKHDGQTDLPNLLALEEHLGRALARMDDGRSLALMMTVEIDQLKTVNNSVGHKAGEQVLREVATRLRGGLRDGDMASRGSGDKFVLMLRDYGDDEQLAQLAHRLMAEIGRPIKVGLNDFVLTASVGIAVYPADGGEAGALISNSDTAMHQAKAKERGNCRFFTAEMNTRISQWVRLQSDLRKAQGCGQLEVRYQPQFQITDLKLVGFEALLRWNHPELGMVPPSRFIPIAEETGLIIPIGEFVLREACRQSRAWQDAGLPPVTVAINVSAVQFHQTDLVALVQSALADSGLDPALLELEMTESMLMQDVDHVVEVLHKLKGAGVGISIDDFGTGYSSLTYLKRFPIDKIKIDQSFVRDILASEDDASIVQTVIAIATRMRMRSIAEGVESAEQLEALNGFGCDEVQGYLFSPAVTADAAARFLREHIDV